MWAGTVAWEAAGTAGGLAGSAVEAGPVEPDASEEAERTGCRGRKTCWLIHIL